MPGCRALKKPEIVKILASLKSPRDRALFTLGLSTGFRISELLSLQVSDVFQFGAVVDRVRVRAMYMKGKDATREVVLNEASKSAILELMKENNSGPLFKSREGNGAISRRQANQILKDVFNQLELNGKLATHSMRKTFAETVHRALGNDIFKTSKAMGHKGVSSTASYLCVDQSEIDAAILKG